MADEQQMQSPATRHETAAVSIIADVGKVLDIVREAATHGNYTDARNAVKDARDRLYFAEIELRKAELAARQKST